MSDDAETARSAATTSTATSNDSTAPSLTVATTAPADDQLTTAPRTARQGEEIGDGSIGPRIQVPQPWPVGTIYHDLEPQTLIVDFIPPNRDCIAAQANATIGRGGAILVTVWVDGEHTEGPCPESAVTNQIRIPLEEPIGDRRTYTSTIPDTGGASERAELVADAIIGLPADEATNVVRREGFEVRDNTNAEEVDSDFNPDRINIWIVDGNVDFAAVY